jgi:hypothetical protein
MKNVLRHGALIVALSTLPITKADAQGQCWICYYTPAPICYGSGLEHGHRTCVIIEGLCFADGGCWIPEGRLPVDEATGDRYGLRYQDCGLTFASVIPTSAANVWRAQALAVKPAPIAPLAPRHRVAHVTHEGPVRAEQHLGVGQSTVRWGPSAPQGR